MKEDKIVQTAIYNLKINLNIEARWLPGNNLDGEITINRKGDTLKYDAVIKQELRTHQLKAILDLHKDYPNLLIVAQRIYPKEKQQLREAKIPYIEANGNIYVENKTQWLWIDNQKNEPLPKETGNRAYTKTGLKVLFHFLLDKELINRPHRDIAKITGVALGNIPQVINGLMETGYIQKLDKKTYVWDKRALLLDRWITEYNTTLKPNLKKGRYKLQKNYNELLLDMKQTVWGGEPAADILTNYLRPEKYTLYTHEHQLDLMKRYKLLPDPAGDVAVYDMFWNFENATNTAPPLLVYADLLLEGGKRNNETAQIIFDEYIKPNL